MLITRESMCTGEVHTLDIPVTAEQLLFWELNPNALIQDVFPNLTPSQREFLKTGITDEEWDKLFGEDE